MTGAMYAAISGLKAHMNKLNVIGNNIANVNTYGYKAGRTVFETALYTTMRSGSNGTTVVGGRNPSQIGYGAQISTIDLDMSSGSYSPTGRALDCMISGDGFFLVGDKSIATDGVIKGDDPNSLSALTLTRVGNFEFKADGYLCDGAGNPVYGFMCTDVDEKGNPIVSDQLVPIRYPKFDGGPKLDADGQPITDADGNPIMEGKVAFPTDKGRDWQEGDPLNRLEDAKPVDADGNVIEGEELPFAQFDSISIDEKTGKISGYCKDTKEHITIGFLAIGNVTNPNGVTQMNGSYMKAGDGSGALSIGLLGGVAESLKTSAGGFLTHVNSSLLDLADDEVPPDGMRIGNTGGMQLFTGGLEGSKTDLATEISEMITTQRGYQANTRIITVTDAMLEELVNIKR